MKRLLTHAFLMVSCYIALCHSEATWKQPGCHIVGYSRPVAIADCIIFNLTTNACRGFCESVSVPSSLDTLRVNPQQSITSYGECCNMIESEMVEVELQCIDGIKKVNFKSATQCQCYDCKKD